jgi:hypothetical protein
VPPIIIVIMEKIREKKVSIRVQLPGTEATFQKLCRGTQPPKNPQQSREDERHEDPSLLLFPASSFPNRLNPSPSPKTRALQVQAREVKLLGHGVGQRKDEDEHGQMKSVQVVWEKLLGLQVLAWGQILTRPHS